MSLRSSQVNKFERWPWPEHVAWEREEREMECEVEREVKREIERELRSAPEIDDLAKDRQVEEEENDNEDGEDASEKDEDDE